MVYHVIIASHETSLLYKYYVYVDVIACCGLGFLKTCTVPGLKVESVPMFIGLRQVCIFESYTL